MLFGMADADGIDTEGDKRKNEKLPEFRENTLYFLYLIITATAKNVNRKGKFFHDFS